MWNWLAGKKRYRRTQPHVSGLPVEILESRALLAGDVRVSFNGDNIRVTGDEGDNAIRVRKDASSVIIEGLEGTTINGAANAVVLSNDPTTLKGRLWIYMEGGNDKAVIANGVTAQKGVRLYGGDGDDALSAVGVTFQALAGLFGDNGKDTISVQDCTINGNLDVQTHDGDDLVSVTDTVVSGSGLLGTGDGDDRISVNNVGGTGLLKIRSGKDDDSIAIQNTIRSGDISVVTRTGQDAVILLKNTLAGNLVIRTGVQNDAVQFREGNTFNGPVRVNGGKNRSNDFGDITGGDQVRVETGNTFNSRQSIVRSEGDVIPAAVTTRFDGTSGSGGLIKDAAAADTAADSLASSMTLTATAASTQSITGTGGVLITRAPDVTITGKTIAGSTVTVDSNEDGIFNDASVTADATGDYSVTVTMTRKDLYTTVPGDDGLTGRRSVKVRSAAPGVGQKDAAIEVDYVTGTVVQFTSELGTYELEMFDAEAPGVVTNFLNYVNPQAGATDGRYTNSFIHRSVDNFVIQGGGFTINNGVINDVSLDNSVTGEFSALRTNIKGTISMAHAGDPNVLSSQWFVNTVDNPSLDDFEGRRHTVFGRLVGNSQTVVDAIAALNQVDLKTQSGSSALGEVPLRTTFTEFTRSLTGTISTTANSTQIIGTGTKFTEELKGALFGLRSRIQINGQAFFVASIDSDTQLTVTQAPTFSAVNVAAKSDFQDSSFVKFTSVKRVLVPPAPI
jgi:cyclophilin family peptidyl-prolyl cis-trans isomerase